MNKGGKVTAGNRLVYGFGTSELRFRAKPIGAIADSLVSLEEKISEDSHELIIGLGFYVNPSQNPQPRRFGKVARDEKPTPEYLGMEMVIRPLKSESGAYTGQFEAEIIQVFYHDLTKRESIRRAVDSILEPAMEYLAKNLLKASKTERKKVVKSSE